METIKKIIDFLKNVANDPRIPKRDKKVLLVLIALVVSPIDLIPDWIPIVGVLDDIVMIALILDYFFEILDTKILHITILSIWRVSFIWKMHLKLLPK